MFPMFRIPHFELTTKVYPSTIRKIPHIRRIRNPCLPNASISVPSLLSCKCAFRVSIHTIFLKQGEREGDSLVVLQDAFEAGRPPSLSGDCILKYDVRC